MAVKEMVIRKLTFKKSVVARFCSTLSGSLLSSGSIVGGTGNVTP